MQPLLEQVFIIAVTPRSQANCGARKSSRVWAKRAVVEIQSRRKRGVKGLLDKYGDKPVRPVEREDVLGDTVSGLGVLWISRDP